MSDIILHHFPSSPFAEKVRLALGIKGLEWQSVTIPMVMPKPLLTALTGGYRKTPVMQVGADIYCDTQCIARALDAMYPQPPLFPQHSEGIAMALSHWGDSPFFQPGAGLSMGTNKELPDDILQDRREFFNFIDFETMEAQLPHFYSQFRAHLQLLETQLDGGSAYILGDEPGWADIVAYFPLWMARGNIAATESLVSGLPALLSWEKRMQKTGHGLQTDLPGEQALNIARIATSKAVEFVTADAWPQGLEVGSDVSVAPHDYGAVPVIGELVRLTHTDIALRRSDPAAGEVVVHFPRIGYKVETLL
tara:strand:- start:5232 stop:6152 length:921 start_codon:yes stop_codon:yes gene_type:complete